MTPAEVYMIAYLVNKGIKMPMMDQFMKDPMAQHFNEVHAEFLEKLTAAYEKASVLQEPTWVCSNE